METLFPLFIKIILMMLFGFVIKKNGLLPDDLEQGMAALLLKAIVPLSILASGNVTLSAQLSTGLKLSAAATAGYYLVSILLLRFLRRFLPLTKQEKLIFVVTAVYGNTAFIGFPLMQALYGSEGMLYAVIFNIGYQLTFFTWATSRISGSGTMEWRVLLRTPVTLASFATALLVLTPLSLPMPLQDTCSAIGSMTTPLSLMLIGSSFVRIRPLELLIDRWSYLVNALRLILLPVGMLGVVALLHFPTVPGAVCVLMSGLPCASLGVIYAERYNCAPGFAARVVIQSTLLMLLTFPLLIILVKSVL